MEPITKKIFAILFAVILGFNVAMAQMNTVKHTVNRGETLSSIAQRYGTTTDKIVELNPEAAQFIYVGMELTVPVVAASEAQPTAQAPASNVTHYPVAQGAGTVYNISASNEDSEGPGWGIAMDIGLGFPDIDGGKTYEIALSVPYWFNEKESGLFASAGLGYSSSFGSSSERVGHYTASSSYSISLISIPLKVGYAITGNKNIALTPYIGLNLGITVAGNTKIKYGGEEQKYKIESGKFAPDFRLGAYLRLWGVNLGGHFAVPISDDSKAVYGSSRYFEASIGWGF